MKYTQEEIMQSWEDSDMNGGDGVTDMPHADLFDSDDLVAVLREISETWSGMEHPLIMLGVTAGFGMGIRAAYRRLEIPAVVTRHES